MFTQLLLSVALSPGQSPAPGPDAPAPPLPPYSFPAYSPYSAIPTLPLTATPPPVTVTHPPPMSANFPSAVPCDVCPVGEPPAGPTSLFMKTVQGTRIGDFMAAHRLNLSGFADLRYTGTNVDNLSRIPYKSGLSYNRDVPQRAWTTFEMAVDKDAYDPTCGFRVDFLAGSAYQYTLADGFLTYQLRDKENGLPRRIGFDIPQFYFNVYLPGAAEGTDIKIGRTFTRFGYESLNPTQSVLPSYSYARTFSPYTMTGVFIETNVNDEYWIQTDFSNGHDRWFENASRFYFWGGMRYASLDCDSTFVGGVLLGSGQYDRTNRSDNQQLVDMVLTKRFGDNLTFAFEFLYGWQFEVPTVGYADYFSFVNYLTYEFNPKWSTTLRVEFFNDTDGVKTGYRGLYGSYTLGLTWKPCPAVTIRPEIRYDRCNNALAFDGREVFFGGMINAILAW